MQPGYENYVVPSQDVGHNCAHRRFHLPADTVACYRFTVLFADGKANSAKPCVIGAVQHYKVLVRNACGVLVHVVVLIVFFKSVNRLQSVTLLCRKSMTTLVSASSKRSASAGGLHSCAKSVHFASLSFLGLVSSFHFCLLYHFAGGAR